MTSGFSKWAPIATIALVAGAALAGSAFAQSGGGTHESGASAAGSAGMIQDRTASSPEGKLFVEKCSMCHRKLGMGTMLLARRMDPAIAELEKRDNLTVGYVTLVVRRGIGNMPPLSRGEVSDAQLHEIAQYLAKGKAQ